MTDPIEQAREEHEKAVTRANSAIEHGDTAPAIDAALDASDAAYSVLEQAILRYHPDVVRLVERLGAWEQWADDGCPAGLRPAALVPFTTEEESE